MNIDIKGHSGCNIDIIEEGESLHVKKSTKDKKYLNRLELQGKKQQNDECLTDYISSPYVYEVKKTDDECYILMSYIYRLPRTWPD